MNDDCATGCGNIVNEGGIYCHDCAVRIAKKLRRAALTDGQESL